MGPWCGPPKRKAQYVPYTNTGPTAQSPPNQGANGPGLFQTTDTYPNPKWCMYCCIGPVVLRLPTGLRKSRQHLLHLGPRTHGGGSGKPRTREVNPSLQYSPLLRIRSKPQIRKQGRHTSTLQMCSLCVGTDSEALVAPRQPHGFQMYSQLPHTT